MSVFDLPMTARPGKDAIVGQDELGRTVYRTVTGERYTMPERVEMPAPTMGQRFENLGGLASRAYEGLSVQGAIDAAKGLGEGIISGIVQGFTAPGRALSGEPVSFGDVLATAGMAQAGAAPMRAPAGSLRSGATGGGRPPVTFDDVARAMDEGAPAPSPRFTLYQGSPHNFSAERLVRMPDGSTQYIVGAPDRLPDVPAGAEVLKDFPLGRQRSDKIGTGEGAQSYGYGLYGAEAEDVAKGYRDVLSANAVTNDPSVNAFDIVKNMGGNVQAAIDLVRSVAENASPDTQQFLRETLKHLENKTYSDLGRSRGYMYELDINADPEAFLDWDMPLAGQAPEIQKAVRMFAPRAPGMASGRKLLNEIGGDVPNPQGFNADRAMVAASGKLREAGVPGIRYLDAGSRSTGGTRNFVIFDENLISIVRKYGIAGAAAMLGVSAIDVEQALADNLPQDQWESLVVDK